MNLFVGDHKTYPRSLGAIKRWGLIPRRPAEHNYPGSGSSIGNQPEGVYVMVDGGREWRPFSSDMRTVRVTYAGPMQDDHLVDNAIVLLDRVPPEWIQL